jgi:FlaA1/EpsC-like NDP-sugar epimerase
MLLRWRNWIIFVTQSAAIGGALIFAWLLRFDFRLPHGRLLFSSAALLLVIRLTAMYAYKLNHGYWRYTGIGDLKDLVKAVLVASIVFFALLRGAAGILAFPLSVYVLEGMLAFLFLAGLRVGARLYFQWRGAKHLGTRTPVIVVGAGSAAVLLLQGLKETNYVAVGLVDDDLGKRRTKLRGVPVFGPIDELPLLAHRLLASEILIAIPSATASQMLRITNFCARAGLPFRTMPSLADLIAGRMRLSEFRRVNLDELLQREPVQLETNSVRAKLGRRVVMVTGAAGSIGSELCKQIIRFQPWKLICVDQAETPLFNLQQHMLGGVKGDIVFSVADITDSERMRRLLLEHHVEVIFHAAAYKHVPLLEENPYEGFKNNVFGLLDLVETAEACGCEDFLLISSDKAVKPSSLMGCTKRIGEMIVGSREPSRMRCVSVRFGNVLGSQGSVIPVFQEQIRTRRSITVTHPEMTRYFMTIPEAVSLVLQAFTVGEHGNILVLDMGEPLRIRDLAKTLIRMSGLKENEVSVVYSGIRPGEKLSEELFYDSEVQRATMTPKIMCAEATLPGWPALRRRLDELGAVVHSRSGDLIRSKVKQMIPEYQWEQPLLRVALESRSEIVEANGHEKHRLKPQADSRHRERPDASIGSESRLQGDFG